MRKLGEQFFRALKNELFHLQFDLDGMHIDHLCYRVSMDDEYQNMKKLLLQQGVLLGETPVGGRPISTFQLNEPLVIDGFSIPMIELPAPKIGSPYSTGFEHAEVLIQKSFESIQKQYPHLQFHSSKRKILNPELSLSTRTGKLKLHHHPLHRVLEIEQAQISDIIFDLDGTLVDSVNNVRNINRQVFSTLLQRDISDQEALEKFRPNFPTVFEAFNVHHPAEQNKALQLWTEFAQQETPALFPGVDDLLQSLLQEGYQLHLWTAREPTSTESILKNHRIMDVFKSVNPSFLGRSKPDRNSLKRDFLSNPKNSVLVIGDSTADILGAIQIQAIAAGAIWCKHAIHENLISAGMEVCFHQIEEILPWLSQIRRNQKNKF